MVIGSTPFFFLFFYSYCFLPRSSSRRSKHISRLIYRTMDAAAAATDFIYLYKCLSQIHRNRLLIHIELWCLSQNSYMIGSFAMLFFLYKLVISPCKGRDMLFSFMKSNACKLMFLPLMQLGIDTVPVLLQKVFLHLLMSSFLCWRD